MRYKAGRTAGAAAAWETAGTAFLPEEVLGGIKSNMKKQKEMPVQSSGAGADLVHVHADDEGMSFTHTDGAGRVHTHVDSEGHIYTHSHSHTDSEGRTYTHTHSHAQTKAVLNRLSRAIGHLESIRRMVEDGRDCTEVLLQLSAVKAAINNTGKIILQDHIEHCIVDAVEHGDKEAIKDLEIAIDRFIK